MNDQLWNRRILLVLLALFILLVLLLILWLRDFVRETILIPFSYALWLGGIFLRSTPQFVFWGILLAIGLILAVRSLWVAEKPNETAPTGEIRNSRRQRVGFWLFQVYLAREGYSRMRFAEFFSRLALEILAFREGITPVEADARLQGGVLETAPEIAAFLQTRRQAVHTGESGWRGWLAHRLDTMKESLAGRGDGRRAQAAEAELEKALRHLEDQLEVKHDD
jgi:hypothetical protein